MLGKPALCTNFVYQVVYRKQKVDIVNCSNVYHVMTENDTELIFSRMTA